MEDVLVQLLVLLGGGVASFFGLMKWQMKKQTEIAELHAERQREISKLHAQEQKELTETFLNYIKIKNGNLERVADKFAKHVEKTNDTMTNVAVRLKENSDAVKEALREHRR